MVAKFSIVVKSRIEQCKIFFRRLLLRILIIDLGYEERKKGVVKFKKKGGMLMPSEKAMEVK
jgi:hypothetical protein